MRVGLTLHYIRDRKITGIERYGLSAANGLAEALSTDFDLQILASRAAAGSLSVPREHLSVLPGDWRLVAEQAIVPVWSRWKEVDLVHVPAFGGPLWRSAPFVLTLHDAAYWDAEEALSFLGRHYYRDVVERALRSRRLRATIYPSAAGRDAVLRHFPQLRDSAYVCGGATELPFSDSPRHWHDRQDGPLRILSVSTIEPRKNYSAMGWVVRRLGEMLRVPVEWQIVGRRGWTGPAEEEVLKLPEVRWYGFASDADLAALYRDADLFLSLSHLEGFNIPMIEAMGQGTPAVVSDIPVHAEIAGDAAIRCNAADVEATTRAIACLLTEEDAWNRASNAAWSRARMYTPRALGRRLLDVYTAVG